ncbi:MAG TPA: vWA domain-containing protein [Kofleriaceae bacterium]|nr:vWA domain-containing protein [Kofleriaceae bacterium]
MPSRSQRLVSYGISSTAAAAIVAAALLTPWARPPADDGPGSVPTTNVTPSEPGTHAIDVVFAVDTTGSMGELIEGAKRTVWSIATHIRQTDPNANLRIGLVAYRDAGDAYVTKPFSLTSDLDAVYAELAAYNADGGDDFPENVAAALRDALAMRWRAGAKKLIFVVGDAPPIDRGDARPYDVLAREAASSGIIINAIRCGSNPATATAFQQLASLGGGDFSTIAQDGGVKQVATPYDEKLAELSARIDRTAVIVGNEAARAGYAAKMQAAEAAPAPAKADRATYYARKAVAAKGHDLRDADDLVGAYSVGATDLGTVKPGALPADLRGKSAAELKHELERRAEEREQAQRELAKLAKDRDAYLSTKAGGGGFDAAVKATVEKQLK